MKSIEAAMQAYPVASHSAIRSSTDKNESKRLVFLEGYEACLRDINRLKASLEDPNIPRPSSVIAEERRMAKIRALNWLLDYFNKD